MYTWGYLKENILSKLNLDEAAANDQGFLSKFPFYANEAMTQICSAIKPNEKFYIVNVEDKQIAWKKCTKEFEVYLTEQYPIDEEELDEYDDLYEQKKKFWRKWNKLHFVNEPITFPEDFIAFSDDVAEFEESAIYIGNQIVKKAEYREAFDEELDYYGYNQVICKKVGSYKIPYKARWFFFTKTLEDNVVLPIPADICDAIPFYVTSQCYKIDDETRSAILRNEFEMALARIDDTSFRSQRTFHIDGGW